MNKLGVFDAQTEELNCIVCDKPLEQNVLCYTRNGMHFTTVPLCPDCLRKGADLLEQKLIVKQLLSHTFPVMVDINWCDATDDSICYITKTFISKEDCENQLKALQKDKNIRWVKIQHIYN